MSDPTTHYPRPGQDPAPAPAPAPADKQPAKPNTKGAAGIITAIIFVLCIGGVAIAAFSGNDPDPVADNNSTDAEVMCEQFIEKRLKAPASAQYPDPQTVKAGATYTVTGVVDSQNSFGAMVRNDYVCKVTNQGDDNWLLNDLTLAK